MANVETLRIHINPDNRRISINDPEYQRSWEEAFEQTRARIEADLKEQLERGELQIPSDPTDPQTNTPERFIRYMAHSQTEITMQDWALNRGIGMVGVSSGYDHGVTIEYVDDPDVDFLDFKVEKAA